MTCIKTGLNVHFENYALTVRADLYRVGNCFIVRWMPEGREFKAWQSGDALVSYWLGDAVWHRAAMGVSVVPDDYFFPPEQAELIMADRGR